MEFVSIKTKTNEDGQYKLVLNFNKNAYRYLYAVLNNKLYKNKGTQCNPSTASCIRRCLLMYALIYVYNRHKKQIIRNGLFNPISNNDSTIKGIRTKLETSYLIFTEKYTFIKQTYPETTYNTDIFYEICTWSNPISKVESFEDNGDYVELECFYDKDPDCYVEEYDKTKNPTQQ